MIDHFERGVGVGEEAPPFFESKNPKQIQDEKAETHDTA